MLDYEADDRFTSIFVLELLSKHRHEYDLSETFNQNMVRILKVDDRFVITEDTKKEILRNYLDMNKDESFFIMLEEAISFFETICFSQQK